MTYINRHWRHICDIPNKYNQRTQRMSLRVPDDIKNHIWARARAEGISATDVVVDILAGSFKTVKTGTYKSKPKPRTPATPAAPKGGASHGKDVFA